MRDRRLRAASRPKYWGLLLAAVTVLLLPLRGGAEETPEVPPAATSQAATESVERALERLDKREFDLSRALDSTRLDLASAQRRFEAA
jgi:hypothetical protein